MKFDLVIITSPDAIANEAKWLNALFEAGLKKLHVRKPGITKHELRSYLSQIPKKYHPHIVLHSHYSLINEFSLGGIHLTENARRKKLSGYYNKRKHSFSASFHSVKDLKNSRRKYDYVFLSPVFDSLSKKGYKSVFEAEELHAVLSKQGNIIALGGIDPTTVSQVQKMRFRGAATLGYIWKSNDPANAFRRLSSKIK